MLCNRFFYFFGLQAFLFQPNFHIYCFPLSPVKILSIISWTTLLLISTSLQHSTKKNGSAKKKVYARKDLPYFVIDACTKALAIPSCKMTRFPTQNISVTDLLKKSLPPRSSALITSKRSTWFSKEKPHSSLDCLMDGPIPNDDFLDKLNDDTGQAWLDGARSIIDQRFNDGRDRLLLCAVTYWREMS